MLNDVKNAQLPMHTILTNLAILKKAKKARKSSENPQKKFERSKKSLKNPQPMRKSEKQLIKCIIMNRERVFRFNNLDFNTNFHE